MAIRGIFKKLGVSMIEMIMVLAVIAILAAVGVPSLFAFVEAGRQTNRMNIARTLYMSSQNQLTELRITGRLADAVEHERTNFTDGFGEPDSETDVYARIGLPVTEEAENDGLVHFLASPAGEEPFGLMARLLSPVIDRAVLTDGAIILEFNVQTGVVLSAFYGDRNYRPAFWRGEEGEEGWEFDYDTSGLDPDTVNLMPEGLNVRGMGGENGYEPPLARARRQGYYGVDNTSRLPDDISPMSITIYDSYDDITARALRDSLLLDPDNPDPTMYDDEMPFFGTEPLLVNDNFLFARIGIPAEFLGESGENFLEDTFTVSIPGYDDYEIEFTLAAGGANTPDTVYNPTTDPDSKLFIEQNDTGTGYTLIWILDDVRGDTTTGDGGTAGFKTIRSIGDGFNPRELISVRINNDTKGNEAESFGKHPYCGVGSTTVSFNINSSRHLYNIRYVIDNFFEDSNSSSVPNGQFRQGASIDVSGTRSRVSNFDPIRRENNMSDSDPGFAGVYYGNAPLRDFMISNLIIEIPDTNPLIGVGLFTRVETGGIVNDLTLENPDIKVDGTTTSRLVGSVTGVNNGTISRAYVTYRGDSANADRRISLTGTGPNRAVGGIVGRSLSSTSISNSVFISVFDEVHIEGEIAGSTGGIVGDSIGAAIGARLRNVYFLALAPQFEITAGAVTQTVINPIAGNDFEPTSTSEELLYLSGKPLRPSASLVEAMTPERHSYNEELNNGLGEGLCTVSFYERTLLTGWSKNRYLTDDPTPVFEELTEAMILEDELPPNRDDPYYPYHFLPEQFNIVNTDPHMIQWPLVSGEQREYEVTIYYYEVYSNGTYGFWTLRDGALELRPQDALRNSLPNNVPLPVIEAGYVAIVVNEDVGPPEGVEFYAGLNGTNLFGGSAAVRTFNPLPEDFDNVALPVVITPPTATSGHIVSGGYGLAMENDGAWGYKLPFYPDAGPYANRGLMGLLNPDDLYQPLIFAYKINDGGPDPDPLDPDDTREGYVYGFYHPYFAKAIYDAPVNTIGTSPLARSYKIRTPWQMQNITNLDYDVPDPDAPMGPLPNTGAIMQNFNGVTYGTRTTQTNQPTPAGTPLPFTPPLATTALEMTNTTTPAGSPFSFDGAAANFTSWRTAVRTSAVANRDNPAIPTVNRPITAATVINGSEFPLIDRPMVLNVTGTAAAGVAPTFVGDFSDITIIWQGAGVATFGSPAEQFHMNNTTKQFISVNNLAGTGYSNATFNCTHGITIINADIVTADLTLSNLHNATVPARLDSTMHSINLYFTPYGGAPINVLFDPTCMPFFFANGYIRGVLATTDENPRFNAVFCRITGNNDFLRNNILHLGGVRDFSGALWSTSSSSDGGNNGFQLSHLPQIIRTNAPFYADQLPSQLAAWYRAMAGDSADRPGPFIPPDARYFDQERNIDFTADRGYSYRGVDVPIPAANRGDGTYAYLGGLDSVVRRAFGHVYRGNDLSVSNVTVSNTIAGAINTGLFSMTGPGGWIFDLTLIDSSITGIENTGGIVGSNSGMLINLKTENVTVTGTTADNINTGGIAGYNDGYIYGNHVIETTVTGIENVGGLVGLNTNIISAYTDDLSETGEIIEINRVSDSTITGILNVGGAVGNNMFSLTAAHIASIETTIVNPTSVTGEENVGGIAGLNTAHILWSGVEYSTVTGTVGNSTGGITGHNFAGLTKDVYFLSLSDPWNRTGPGAPSQNDAPVSSNGGGIVGLNDGHVENAFYYAPAPRGTSVDDSVEPPINVTTIYPIVRSGEDAFERPRDDGSGKADETCFYLAGQRYSINSGNTWINDLTYNLRISGNITERIDLGGGGQGLVSAFIELEWLDFAYRAELGSWSQPSIGFPYPVINGMPAPTAWPMTDSPVRPDQLDTDDWTQHFPTALRPISPDFVNGNFGDYTSGITIPSGTDNDLVPPYVHMNNTWFSIDMRAVDGWYTRPIPTRRSLFESSDPLYFIPALTAGTGAWNSPYLTDPPGSGNAVNVIGGATVGTGDWQPPYSPNNPSQVPRWRLIEFQEPNGAAQFMRTNYRGESRARGATQNVRESSIRYAELNAESQGTLYQILPTSPGSTFFYSFYHATSGYPGITPIPWTGYIGPPDSGDRLNFYLSGFTGDEASYIVSNVTDSTARDNAMVMIRPAMSPRTGPTDPVDGTGVLPATLTQGSAIWNPAAWNTVDYGESTQVAPTLNNSGGPYSLAYHDGKTYLQPNGRLEPQSIPGGTLYLYDVWIGAQSTTASNGGTRAGYGITFWSQTPITGIPATGYATLAEATGAGLTAALTNTIGYWGVQYGWKHFYGEYTVPAGQNMTEFAFQSASGPQRDTVGNYLDGVSFKTPAFLSIDKTVRDAGNTTEVGFVKPNDILTIQLNVTSWGDVAADNIVIRDRIAPFEEYLNAAEFIPGSVNVTAVRSGASAPVTVTSSYNSVTDELIITLPPNVRLQSSNNIAVTPNDSLVVTFQIRVRPYVLDTTFVPGYEIQTLLYYFRNQGVVDYRNDAIVNSNNLLGYAGAQPAFAAPPGRVITNGSGPEPVQVFIDPIELDKQVTSPASQINGPFNIALTVENTMNVGDIVTTGLITDVLPPGFRLTSGITGQVINPANGAVISTFTPTVAITGPNAATNQTTRIAIWDVSLNDTVKMVRYSYTMQYIGSGYGVSFVHTSSDYRYLYSDSDIADPISVRLNFPQPVVGISLRTRPFGGTATAGTLAIFDITSNDNFDTDLLLPRRMRDDNYDVTPRVILTDDAGNEVMDLIDGNQTINVTGQYTATLRRADNVLEFTPEATPADGFVPLYYQIVLTATRAGAAIPSFTLSSPVTPISIFVEGAPVLVYYEQYDEGGGNTSYGFSGRNQATIIQGLDPTKVILETGYGVLSSTPGNPGYVSLSATEVPNAVGSLSLYKINSTVSTLPPIAATDLTLIQVTFNSLAIGQFHPNFAQAVFDTTATPPTIFYINTPQQLLAMNDIDPTTAFNGMRFIQGRNITVTVPSGTTVVSSIIAGTFATTYSGTYDANGFTLNGIIGFDLDISDLLNIPDDEPDDDDDGEEPDDEEPCCDEHCDCLDADECLCDPCECGVLEPCCTELCECWDVANEECPCDPCECEDNKLPNSIMIPMFMGAFVAGPAIAGTITKINNRMTRRKMGKLVKRYSTDKHGRRVRIFSRRRKK